MTTVSNNFSRSLLSTILFLFIIGCSYAGGNLEWIDTGIDFLSPDNLLYGKLSLQRPDHPSVQPHPTRMVLHDGAPIVPTAIPEERFFQDVIRGLLAERKTSYVEQLFEAYRYDAERKEFHLKETTGRRMLEPIFTFLAYDRLVRSGTDLIPILNTHNVRGDSEPLRRKIARNISQVMGVLNTVAMTGEKVITDLKDIPGLDKASPEYTFMINGGYDERTGGYSEKITGDWIEARVFYWIPEGGRIFDLNLTYYRTTLISLVAYKRWEKIGKYYLPE